MELSKKSVGIIIALIVFSLAGLVVLQTYLLKYTIELKEQAFNRGVFAALNSVVHQLETDETAATTLDAGSNFTAIDSLPPMRVEVLAFDSDSNALNENIFSFKGCADSLQPVWIENGVLHYSLTDTQHVTIQAFDQTVGKKIMLVDTCKTPGSHRVKLLNQDDTGNNYMYRFKSDSANVVIQVDGFNQSGFISQNISGLEKRKLVARVINNLTMIEWEPIENRIDQELLDSTIAAGLNASGIDLDYIYGVKSLDDDSLRIVNLPGYTEQLSNSEYKASLFPHDLFSPSNTLFLYFPDHGIYMLKQVAPLLFPSILLMLIIVFCFVYTIKTIISQKTFGRLMVDFINNMTHEFKTPISSISLASDAIMRPEIISQQDKVARYNRMIKDENLRLRNQVEKILQMAVLENKDYDLELEEIDIHEILARTVRYIALQVENRAGKITTALDAKNHFIKADVVHLSNIIHNLLDNANKYSPETPNITVTTRDFGKQIIIGIQDNGIGLDEKSIKLVFNKYYRVPTGNIHDVKGFGLGLSYVKLMVEAHEGFIRLKSKPGEGTLVELYFPVVIKED